MATPPTGNAMPNTVPMRFRRVRRRTGQASIEVRKIVPPDAQVTKECATAHWLLYHEWGLVDVVIRTSQYDNATTEQHRQGYAQRYGEAMIMLLRDNELWNEMPIETFLKECRDLKLTPAESGRAKRIAEAMDKILADFNSRTNIELQPDYVNKLRVVLRIDQANVMLDAMRDLSSKHLRNMRIEQQE